MNTWVQVSRMQVCGCHVVREKPRGPDMPALLRKTKDVSWQRSPTCKLSLIPVNFQGGSRKQTYNWCVGAYLGENKEGWQDPGAEMSSEAVQTDFGNRQSPEDEGGENRGQKSKYCASPREWQGDISLLLSVLLLIWLLACSRIGAPWGGQHSCYSLSRR